MKSVYNCTGHRIALPDIVAGLGRVVTDSAGKQYYDFESGVWCMSIGHNDQGIREAAFRQWNRLVHAGFAYSSAAVDAAAKRVLRITKMADGQCVFLCSGSEAIEISRQIARDLTGFETSLTFTDSYLGAYRSASDRRSGWHLLDWVRHAGSDGTVSQGAVDRLVDSIPDNVADFIFEPGSSSGHVRFPPPLLVDRVVEKVRRNGGKVIANEVTTGTGRTGAWFGYQHYGIEPDMVAIGKGIGNGYPVSVAALAAPIVAELRGTEFHYSQSHQNDPLGAVIVHTVIDTIERDSLTENAARQGERLTGKLQALVDGTIVRAVRGRGLMVAIDFASEDVVHRVYAGLMEKGFIVGNRGSFLRIDPPLTVTSDEIDEFARAFAVVVTEI